MIRVKAKLAKPITTLLTLASTDSVFIKVLFALLYCIYWMIELSMPKELERLKNTRVKLEEESRSLLEQQKNFEETVNVLEEKIAIEEQKHRNKDSQDAISQLESKIKELEQRLEQTSEVAQSEPKPAFKIESEINATPEPEKLTSENVEEKSEVEEEDENENVTVAPLQETLTVEHEEYRENVEKQREKKRRRLF
jgi:hypothetical protein